MKKKHLYGTMLWAFFATAVLSAGCSDDDNDYPDVDGQNPTISLTTGHIQSEIGRTFTIAGKVADKDGIRSIHLQNADLYLDKTIDLLAIYKEPVYEYDLSYQFTTPKTQTGESFTIKVTVTDLGGRTVEDNVLVTMDGDFDAPTFKSAPAPEVAIFLTSEPKYTLSFTVEDNKALDSVIVSAPSLQLERRLKVEGKSYDFAEELNLPEEDGSYEVTIRSVDKFALANTYTTKISVASYFDFEKLYLADVDKEEEMTSDLFGVPMLIEHTGEFTYTARFYNEVANNEIRFVPQKTGFSPICYGIDPEDDTKLTPIPEKSKPIILPEAKKYYEISFNVQTKEFSFKTYEPTDEPLKLGIDIDFNDTSGVQPFQIGLAGAGFPGYASWQTGNCPVLTQDADNPYLLYTTINLEAGSEVEFTISATHIKNWWPEPYWRFEKGEKDSGENEYNTKNGGNNMSKVTVKKSGKYMFKFDTHLLRSRFYPIN